MAVKKNSSYLIFLKKEIEEAAKYAGTDFQTACDVLDNFFETLRMYLEDPRLPSIRVGPLGYFQTTIGAISKFVGKTILAYRTFPRHSLKVFALEKHARTEKIRRRIRLARQGKKDGIVWKLLKKEEFVVGELKRVFKDDYDKYFTKNGKQKFRIDREVKKSSDAEERDRGDSLHD